MAHALLLSRGDADHSEHAADVLAARLFGLPIRYDAMLVQTIDPIAKYPRRPPFLPA
jgi:hypothetical protein